MPPDLGPPLPRFLAQGWPWVKYEPWHWWSAGLWYLQQPEAPWPLPGRTGEFIKREEALGLPPLLARGFPFIRNQRAT